MKKDRLQRLEEEATQRIEEARSQERMLREMSFNDSSLERIRLFALESTKQSRIKWSLALREIDIVRKALKDRVAGEK